MPPGPPPPGSQVIVMDIPRIVAEATRAASDAGVTAADDPKVRALIDKQIEQQLAANQQGLKAMAASAQPRGGGASAAGDGPRLMCRAAKSKWRSRRTAVSSAMRMPC